MRINELNKIMRVFPDNTNIKFYKSNFKPYDPKSQSVAILDRGFEFEVSLDGVIIDSLNMITIGWEYSDNSLNIYSEDIIS